MAGILIRAPLQGWAAPLAEVPDPVFADGMMGQGLAIDPFAGLLHAPCDGEVIHLHRARHAVTLRMPQGAEILLHLGLETVGLDGDGFLARVREGDRVSAGQPLIEFDLDLLALRARSLISPVLVTNGEAFAVSNLRTAQVVQVGDPIFEITPIAAAPASPVPDGPTPAACRPVRLTHPHGLHARPAGLIAAEVKRLGLPVEAHLGARKANARSAVALMGLGARVGDELMLSAQGEGAAAALAVLAELIERDINGSPTPAPQAPAPISATPSSKEGIAGVRASPGLAVGAVFHLAPAAIEPPPSSGDPTSERRAFDHALAGVRAELSARAAAARGPAAEILGAHLELLDDPELVETTRTAIAGGQGAGHAWRQILQAQMTLLRGLDEPRLAERAADLADLEQQVQVALGAVAPAPARPPAGAIVLAADLAPSQMAALQDAAGLCLAQGGPTSHVAILAAAMGLPTLVAAGRAAMEVPDGAMAILDADAGVLIPSPSEAQLLAAQQRAAALRERRAAAIAEAQTPCRTSDGVRIEVFANLGALADAEAAAAGGAEGCGLLRTEFLFLERQTAPGEDEQLEAYQAIASALAGRPVIVRTLDIGSDKPAAYLSLPRSENPALGIRGVRVGLRHPEMLSSQLRAILRVQPAGQCRIMVPMVASQAEMRAVRRLTEAAASAIGRTEPFQLGAMIETPAAAATADLIAAEADFLSIGTNDLAQYALAMDRTDPQLAAEVDGLHPAVLRLIGLTVQGAAVHGRPVGVCGGLASDLAAVPILLGLGVTELSAAPALAPELKALIRSLGLDACRDLARRACALASADEVRQLTLCPPAGARS